METKRPSQAGSWELNPTVLTPQDEVILVDKDGASEVTPASTLIKLYKEDLARTVDKVALSSSIEVKVFGAFANWVDEHKEQVSKGIITLKDSEILMIAMTKETRYNEPLEDSLYDFEISITKDGDFENMCFSTLALPEGSVTTLQNFLSRVSFEHTAS